MRFRITDLLLLTAAVAMFVAAFQTDLQFFRQLFCFVLIASCATVAALSISKRQSLARLLGAIGGLVGGLLYAGVAYLLVANIYPIDPIVVTRQSLVKDETYFIWFQELFPFLLVSPFLGSAIGPLLALRVRNSELLDQFAKPVWISVSLLLAALLLALFAMFDRLTLFGDTRDWSPLILVLLVVFVIYTNSWLARLSVNRKPIQLDAD